MGGEPKRDLRTLKSAEEERLALGLDLKGQRGWDCFVLAALACPGLCKSDRQSRRTQQLPVGALRPSDTNPGRIS